MADWARLLNQLQEIGLSAKESAVYLALITLGTGTAYQIAQHCDVKKPTVYLILEDLRKKGLALKVPHAKKTLYAPRDIQEYISEQEEKLRSVRAIVSQLESFSQQGANVFFFSGMRGIMQAADFKIDTMREKTFHCFYSNLAEAPQEMLDFYRAWDRKTLAMDIFFNIIMAKSGAGKYYKDILQLAKKHENVRIKYLDYKYPTNQTIDIGEDFLRIVDERRMHATIIDDRQTADAMRQIFDVVWEKDL